MTSLSPCRPGKQFQQTLLLSMKQIWSFEKANHVSRAWALRCWSQIKNGSSWSRAAYAGNPHMLHHMSWLRVLCPLRIPPGESRVLSSPLTKQKVWGWGLQAVTTGAGNCWWCAQVSLHAPVSHWMLSGQMCHRLMEGEPQSLIWAWSL